MSKVLYRFHVNCGRMGNLDGVFVSTVEDVEKVIGEYVHFGEVLGKHSDIGFCITKEMLDPITDHPDVVDVLERTLKNGGVGFNPLDYYVGDDEDE